MYMLSYVSESVLPRDGASNSIRNMLAAARSFNARNGITGVLFLRGQIFFQTIEGPKDAVLALYDKIKLDRRHKNPYVILQEKSDIRRFSGWSMEGFHDPKSKIDLQETLHNIGSHFYRIGCNGVCGLSVRNWQLVSQMASCRVAV